MKKLTGFSKKIINNEYIHAILILALILNIIFFPVIWGNKTLMFSVRDVSSILQTGAYGNNTQGRFFRSPDPGAPGWGYESFVPLVHSEYVDEKNFALWNPYQAMGLPLAATMESQVYYPTRFILYLLPPNIKIYDLFLILNFLIAGFLFYLYIRLFIKDKKSSIFGSIAFMLGGYFIFYMGMSSHNAIEILIPAVFYAFEKLLRKRNVQNIIFSSLIIFFTIVGGQPEATFLALSFGYCYYLFRTLTDDSFRKNWKKNIINMIIVNLLGFGLAAILLFPFVELMHNSFNLHEPDKIGGYVGMSVSPNFKFFIGYLIPSAFGPPAGGIFKTSSHLLGYYGIIAFTFAVLGIVALFRFRKDRLNSLTIFFTLSYIFITLKKHGIQPIHSIGLLPIINMVNWMKYPEALLTFAVTVLCSFGFYVLSEKKVKLIHIISAITTVYLMMIVFSIYWIRKIFILQIERSWVFYMNVIIGLLLLSFITVILLIYIFICEKKIRLGKIILYGFIVLLVIELTCTYIVPSYYTFNKLANDDTDPYKGAPYIDFLKENKDNYYRIQGKDAILTPNWAATQKLFDTGFLHGFVFLKYRNFMRNFLLTEEENKIIGTKLNDRFSGNDIEDYWGFNEQRFFMLGSVKYHLSYGPLVQHNPIIEEILEQNQDKRSKYLSIAAYHINDSSKEALFQHPPSERVPYKVKITENNSLLIFSVGMDPYISKKDHGDGVEFTLEIRTKDNNIKKVFSKYIDPKNNKSDRIWHDGKIDLSKYIGEEIEILFSTSPGPLENGVYDWGGWGGLSFTSAKDLKEDKDSLEEDNKFKIIYDKEIIITELDKVLPRASLFYDTRLMNNESLILAILRDPKFDIHKEVIINTKGLSDTEIEQIKKVSNSELEIGSANIRLYESQKVTIEASVEEPTIMVLNDVDYPGWKAYVDGKKTKILNANYLFRGILLEPGEHEITFKYRPTSFIIGFTISLIIIIIMTIMILNRKKLDKKIESI